jgi:hypothetical protein
MGIKVTNNAYGTLSASITSSATTIALATGQGARFPSLGAGDYFFGTLIDTSNNVEIVKVTARSTDSMTVVRGQDNTTARAYSTNDRFELRPTSALFNDFTDRLAEKLPLAGGTLTGNLIAPVLKSEGSGAAVWVDQRNNNTKKFALYSDNEKVYLYSNQGVGDLVNVDHSGRFATPYQPAFHAQNTNYFSTSGIMGSWTEVFDRGSNFNPTTGRFTAPVAGVYFFAMHALFYNLGSASYFNLYKNGSGAAGMSTLGASYAQFSGSYAGQGGGVVIQLAANDYVEYYFTNAGSYLHGGYIYAYGYLLG